jgi:hypothetical protein
MAKSLTSEDLKSIAEKIVDIGHVDEGGMAGSQFISVGNFLLLILGFVLAIEAYVIALVILRGCELA